jgi:transposase
MNATLQKLEARRMKAARLLSERKGIRETARLVKASPAAVCGWKQKLDRHGIQGLRAKPHPGPTPRLDAHQRQRLVRLLLRGARVAGFDTDLWTCPRVAELIEESFGVRYHVDHVWKLLRSLGWSCQKPQQWARERDETAIRRWREHDWPRIKKERAATS